MSAPLQFKARYFPGDEVQIGGYEFYCRIGGWSGPYEPATDGGHIVQSGSALFYPAYFMADDDFDEEDN